MKQTLSILVAAAFIVAAWPAHAGQTKIKDYDDTRDKFFWKELYAAGGVTIYCGQPFTRKLGLEIEHVYPAAWMVDHLPCDTRSKCRSDPTSVGTSFNHMEADLHNLYPARCGTNRSRSSMLFGMASGERRDFGPGCDFEVDTMSKVAEPPPRTRGNVARSIFYMHHSYDLPIPPDTLSMLKRWHAADPPDEEERLRNDAIDAIQETRNPFIDDPTLADAL